MPLSPRAAGFAVRAARAAKAAYCHWLNSQLQNNRDPFNDLVREYQNLVNRPPFFFPGAIVAASACDISPPPVTSDDYKGGQCECVIYTVEWEFREKFGDVVTGAFNLGGPIRGSSIKDVLDGNGNPTREFFIRASLVGSDGSCTPSDIAVRVDPNLLWGRITRVTRVDGLADNCGDPPPPPPPPLGDTFDWQFNWESGDGNSFSTDVSITIGPFSFNSRGGIEIRVTMDLDFNISLGFTFNGLGEVVNVTGPNFYIGNNTGGGSGNGDRRRFFPGGDGREGEQPDDFTFDPTDSIPKEDDLDIPDGSRGEDYNETEPDTPEKQKVIRGVAVTVTSIRSKRPTVIFQDENPDIYAPSLGHVNFRVKIGRNTTFWTNDLTVKNVKSFIPCPWEGGAIEVKGTPQPGIRWVLTPVYSRIELPALSFN